MRMIRRYLTKHPAFPHSYEFRIYSDGRSECIAFKRDGRLAYIRQWAHPFAVKKMLDFDKKQGYNVTKLEVFND